MNDFAKLKHRKSNRLGQPPAVSEVRDNLQAPEIAPEPQKQKKQPNLPEKKDGRSARATGRTEPFATRVREGVRKDYKLTAAKQGITMGQLLEEALVEYKKKHNI